MIIAHFAAGDVQYEKKRLPVVPYKLGIIMQDLRPSELEAAEQQPTGQVVQAREANDTPKPFGNTKGSPILVVDDWYHYMRKLMSQKAWEWWGVWPSMLMKNRDDDHWANPETYPGKLPHFECILLPCNFVASDKKTNQFSRIISRSSVNVPPLDPAKNNWFYEPWMFSKATMHTVSGNVQLVGNGFHVYTPIIRQAPEIWIETSFVEWFPALPMTVTYQGKAHVITGYCLQGASVYGHAENEDIPLRLATKPGECLHPCPEWILRELPVPPEVRPEWA